MAIDEKKLKEDLKKWLEVITKYCNKFNYHDALESYEEAYYIFADIIDEQPKLSLENKTSDWIPCSERLPEEYGWYLCFRYNYKEFPPIDMWYFSKHDSLKSAQGTGIVAWMPLPEAYKGEE